MRPLLLLFFIVTSPLAASPFRGFYIGGGLGGDYFEVAQRAGPDFHGRDGAFRGEGFVGWTGGGSLLHIGGRAGYQGFVGSEVACAFVLIADSLSKSQGAFGDLLFGVRLPCSFYLHGIAGLGWTQYHLRPAAIELFRGVTDQRSWALDPRVGAGIQWNFLLCFALGLEWTYNFPGRPSFSGVVEREYSFSPKFQGNQFALTLIWYFF